MDRKDEWWYRLVDWRIDDAVYPPEPVYERPCRFGGVVKREGITNE
jgi:hypothetical protein